MSKLLIFIQFRYYTNYDYKSQRVYTRTKKQTPANVIIKVSFIKYYKKLNASSVTSSVAAPHRSHIKITPQLVTIMLIVSF